MKYFWLILVAIWVIRLIVRAVESAEPSRRVERRTRRVEPRRPQPLRDPAHARPHQSRCPWCNQGIRRNSWETSALVTCTSCQKRCEVSPDGSARRILDANEMPLDPESARRRATDAGTDPYAVLGVERDADARTMKKAYFKLIRKYTPEDEPEMFRRISGAYRVLSDPEARAEYDGSEHLPEEVMERLDAAFMAIEGDPDRAYEMGEGLLGDHGDSGEVRSAVGMIFIRTLRPARALQVFYPLYKADPGNAEHATGLAVSLFESGRQEKAISLLDKFVRHETCENDVYLTLSRFHAAREEVDEALAVLDKGIRADGKVDMQDLPLFMRRIILLGNLRNFHGMHDAAKALFDIMPEDDPDARAYVSHSFRQLAIAYEDLDAPHLTKFAVDFALRATPDDEELREVSVSLREPARRHIEGEKAFEDESVPDWIKIMVSPSFHQADDFDPQEHLTNLITFVATEGVAARAREWRRFATAYPSVAGPVQEIWEMIESNARRIGSRRRW